MEQDLKNRITEIALQVNPIHGWFDDNAGAFLYKLARLNSPKGPIVELGSWKGRSTVWLANAVKDRNEGCVYAVDTWKGSASDETHKDFLKGYAENQLYNEFLSNIDRAGLSNYVKPVCMDTITAAKKTGFDLEIGLLFIDASHDYEDARKDFEFWSPMVVKGGYIAFHDVGNCPGPTQLVSELPKWFTIVDSSVLYTVQKM